MMKKVLVFGSAGMLGHIVYKYLKSLNKYEIYNTSFPTKFWDDSFLLDATDKLAVESYIQKIKPDILVNCVGILIKGSLQNPANAIYLNSFLPHNLAKILSEINGKLIHISTDCVFSGEKGRYSETDFKDARDTYGLSKALGEVEYDNHLTLRTSIIGPELKENGEGLFDWFMRQKGNVKGYSKAMWSGVTTLELAKVISLVISHNLSGIYHVTDSQPISKYELLKIIKEKFDKTDVKLVAIDGKAVDKSFIDTRNELGYDIPNYTQMIAELRSFMKLYSSYYSRYL